MFWMHLCCPYQYVYQRSYRYNLQRIGKQCALNRNKNEHSCGGSKCCDITFVVCNVQWDILTPELTNCLPNARKIEMCKWNVENKFRMQVNVQGIPPTFARLSVGRHSPFPEVHLAPQSAK